MIPISTDAPIYHYPIATVTMIVINILFFFAFCGEPDFENATFYNGQKEPLSAAEVDREYERLMAEDPATAEAYIESLDIELGYLPQFFLSLEFGKIRPWQWVSNNFMHADLGHLIGNMIFLWGFGLIVEGKGGPILFTAIYLAIGTVYGMLLQLGSLPFLDEGIALGASAVIFGLLAVCVIWAPANEFTVFFGRFFLDVPILVYGGLFFFKEVVFWGLKGFAMDSELLHILGFLVGIPAAIFLVRSGRVDCEGWDIFSYLSGKTGRDSTLAREVNKKKRTSPATSSSFTSQATNTSPPNPQLQDQVKEAIGLGQFRTALQLQEQLMKKNPALKWRQADMYAIIDSLLKAREYELVVPLIEQHLASFTTQQTSLTFALCKLKLALNLPADAHALLVGLNDAFLNDKEKEQLSKLRQNVDKQLRLSP